jgi:23S rRNA (pseudouridine1915-N3)-methyltransferase
MVVSDSDILHFGQNRVYWCSMQVTIISVGKTKSGACLELEEQYAERIRGRFSCTRVVVKNNAQLLEKLYALSGDTVILMDEHGSTMSSREFAAFMDQLSRAEKRCTFVIGGAEGIPEEARAVASDIVALSEMTFPHEVARVLLLEQLYRTQTIIEGHPYHK